MFTNNHIRRLHLLLQLIQPIRHPLMERLGFCQIEYQQSYLRITIIQRHDRAESFITCGVPNIQLYFLAIFSFYFFLLVGAGERGFVEVLEGAGFVAHGDRCFAHGGVAAQHHLDGFLGLTGGDLHAVGGGGLGGGSRLLAVAGVTHIT